MNLIPMIVNLPKVSEAAVNSIESFLSSDKVKSSSLKIEMEKSVVDQQDMKEYIELTLEQFKNCSDDVKYKIRKLKFDGEDSITFAFENSNSKGSYSMTLIHGVKSQDGKHKVFIYYYSKQCEYTTASSFWRWLVGSNTSLDSIFTENNIKSFLVYKLAKYAQEFDPHIKIQFTEPGVQTLSN
jgi:translation initiation factor RLI1